MIITCYFKILGLGECGLCQPSNIPSVTSAEDQISESLSLQTVLTFYYNDIVSNAFEQHDVGLLIQSLWFTQVSSKPLFSHSLFLSLSLAVFDV